MRLFESDPNEPEGVDELFEELPQDSVSEAQARASAHGKEFDREAFEFLENLGAEILETYVRVDGYPLDALIQGRNGARYYVDAHGTPDRTDRPQAGMRRQDTMLKFGFKALRLADRRCPHPLLLITSHLPKPKTSSAFLLTELADSLHDIVATVQDVAGVQRLHRYLNDDPAPVGPIAALWRERQMELTFDDALEYEDD